MYYFTGSEQDAWDITYSHQQGGRHSQYRRSHAAREARNFLCGYIKRGDPVSRRFIQYLHLQSQRVVLLVRDAMTGELLVKPPEDERWLLREKSGLGRASKNQWNGIRSIGEQFFEEADKNREWTLSFKEYYDVYVWDLMANESSASLYNLVQQV